MNNSLTEVHPELVSEWSEKNLPLTPDDITFGSNKKVILSIMVDRFSHRMQRQHQFGLLSQSLSFD